MNCLYLTLLVCLIELGNGAYSNQIGNPYRTKVLSATNRHLVRHRRETTKPGTVCCGTDNLKPMEMSDACNELTKFDESLKGQEKEFAELLGLICAAECEAKSHNMMDGKNLIKSKMVEEFKTMYGKQDWVVKLIDQKVDECMADAEQIQGEIQKAGADVCSSTPFFVGLCLMSTLEKSCPKDLMVITPECNAMRKALEIPIFNKAMS